MNGPVGNTQASVPISVPVGFEAFCPAPLLLPGENLEHYRALQSALFNDLSPQSAVEWLLAIDIAELSWEIRRYRTLRHKLLESYRQKAIETALRRIDVVGIAQEFREVAELYTTQNALDWRLDPTAARDIEARLSSYGFDQHAINMEVYVQARELFLLFEGLLNGAQMKRSLLLRELENYRRGPVTNPRFALGNSSTPSSASVRELAKARKI